MLGTGGSTSLALAEPRAARSRAEVCSDPFGKGLPRSTGCSALILWQIQGQELTGRSQSCLLEPPMLPKPKLGLRVSTSPGTRDLHPLGTGLKQKERAAQVLTRVTV